MSTSLRTRIEAALQELRGIFSPELNESMLRQVGAEPGPATLRDLPSINENSSASTPGRKFDAFVEKLNFQAKLERITPKVYVTQTLVAINIAIFLTMLLAGGGFFEPNGAVHVRWGSNFGPLTTSGQWWRLLTSMFLHFGVIHLAFNMWALYQNGRVAERLYGNFSFLVVYLFAGIAGSMASLVWHANANSAGASGAIFGVLGAMLAFMVINRNHVPVPIMKAQSISTLAFILYSLANGFGSEGIDNAAHVGGLVSGFVFGLILARPPDPERHRAGVLRLVCSLAAMTLALGLTMTLLPRSLNGATTNAGAAAEAGAEAIARLREAATRGDKVAQYNLGVTYRDGNGVGRDYKQAAEWFRKAADQGFALAQSNLGMMYSSGRGLPEDKQAAARWFTKAAEQGLAEAQFNLGLSYVNGQGVPQDDKQAVAWFARAADQGFASAQNSLGVMYEEGHGVERDDHRAAEWYRKAAEHNNANAQNSLGGMYAYGRGVPKDPALAYMFFSLSALNGNEKAARNKAAFGQKLTQREIQEGQGLARMWRPGMPLPAHSGTGDQPVQR